MRVKIILLIIAAVFLTACSRDESDSDIIISWNEDLNGYVVTKFHVESGEMVIPAEYKGYPVVGIYSVSGYNASSVVIPEGITRILFSFTYPGNLKEVNLPDSAEWIHGSFAGSGITHINVSESSPHFTSIDGVLYNKDATELMVYPGGRKGEYIVPDGMKTIYHNSFVSSGNENMESIVLPKSWTPYESVAYEDDEVIEAAMYFNYFDRCSALESIQVHEDNEYFKTIDGVLFSKDMKYLLCYPDARKGESYTVPEGVERIYSTFNNNEFLSEVFLPATIEQIDGDFEGVKRIYVDMDTADFEYVQVQSWLKATGNFIFNDTDEITQTTHDPGLPNDPPPL